MKTLGAPEQRQQSTGTLQRLLNEFEVARLTGRSVSSLRRDRLIGVGITYIKCGALVRYDPRDVREYLERNKRVVEAK